MSQVLSFILLSYNSNQRLPVAHSRISTLMEQEAIPFEFIIVDDGSKDDSVTIARELAKKDARVKSYQLSRNYTSHYAAFAGLSVCTGACAVLIPDDEQLSYKDIVKLYRLWQEGNQVIIPYRESREESWLKRNTSQLFYQLMNRFSDIQFPPGGADSFFIDREVIDIINQRIHPIRTTTITEILRLGFSPVFYPYVRPVGNNNKSRWSFKKKYALAKDFFFSSSTFPIKLITYIGVFFSLFSLALISFYSYIRFFGNQQYWHTNEVPGWVSTIVIISFFSGLILFSLGIIAEYIWRIYEEVKNRPGFLIKNK
jgi:glycosyltransferase involved in cell wall biosynthesis